jgi:hypothetical protein
VGLRHHGVGCLACLAIENPGAQRHQICTRAHPLAFGSSLLARAAFCRFIENLPQDRWSSQVELALNEFAAGFSVATGSQCHATIKIISDIGTGREKAPLDSLEVRTFARTAPRAETNRPGILKNTVGGNTDFRALFGTDVDNRCWHCNDLLTIDQNFYANPHWPSNPDKRNVPYRSTMVWPIRKVLKEASSTSNQEIYVLGFLTIDSKEPNILDYPRHLELGAAFADHLITVLWDPSELRSIHQELVGPSANAVSKQTTLSENGAARPGQPVT